MHFMPIKNVDRFFVSNWFPPNSVPLVSIRTVLDRTVDSDVRCAGLSSSLVLIVCVFSCA
jgi:hypothetical protein